MDKDKESYRIIVSGDSISKGIVFDESKNRYVVMENSYVSLLSSKLKGMVYNVSHFGNTIIRGVKKLKNEVIKDDPDIVLIEYGGNDCDFKWDEVADKPYAEHKANTDIVTFESTLRETINSLTEKKIMPVLMTLPPLNADKYLDWISRNNSVMKGNILKWLGSVTKIYWWHERYNSAIVKIAEETSTRLIDIRGAFLEYPDFTKFICKDGIHPNEQGHKIIADAITGYIKSKCKFLLAAY